VTTSPPAAAAPAGPAPSDGAEPIATLDLRGHHLDPLELRGSLPRAQLDVDAALAVVRPLCEQVRTGGAQALRDLGERFDGVRPEHLRVPAQALQDALTELDPAVRAALEESIRRARVVHEAQRRTDVTTTVVPGGTVTERWVPSPGWACTCRAASPSTRAAS
jgi:histidinol dehydrogenase